MDTEASTQKPIPLWRNRDYLLLWLGQAVSSLGTRLTQFAFPLLIVGLTHSIAAAGLAYGLEQLPYALLSLPAGALVDRRPRKRVMTVCTFCLLLCVASIPLTLLLVSAQLRLFLLYGIVTTPLLLGAVFAGIAIFDSISAILMSSFRLSVVPDALQGRVSGVYRLILFSILTIGPTAIGLSLQHLGVLPTVGIVWSGLLLQAGFMFVNRQMRQATLPHVAA